ncbi:hypothetical protein GO491_01185 [Flavobacteriaceae bacterium Ap0902]|nr:hypothetical protein [Flavobacteriaceae bacterium Ap0902]
MHKIERKYEINILHDYEGAEGAGHQAIAFETKDGKLRYFSRDGVQNENNYNTYGEPEFTDLTFESIAEIQNYYTTEVSQGKLYDQVDVYKATRAQIERGIQYAKNAVKTNYNILWNNCSSLVERALMNTYGGKIYSGMAIPNLNLTINRGIFYKYYDRTYKIQ